MKKRIFLLLLALVSACPALVSATVERGVSRSLARERAAAVSDVSYFLKLSVPAEAAEAVAGAVDINFTYAGSEDLQLDFCGRRVATDGVVNGRSTPLVWEKEHVIVSAKSLRQGQNTVSLTFQAADAALNRHADYLYSLFVPANARTAFPCFDQPDIKAVFSLQLTAPADWKALSNAPVARVEQLPAVTTTTFAPTKKLPTYLFSFVCGRFQTFESKDQGMPITVYYRETDPYKTAQIADVCAECRAAVDWMEQYTGIAYPFDKYDIVILPSYQFGGMEHPGCIQFTDRRIFLERNATIDDRLARTDVITHETAHMWFGDLVTMQWFDDVWTKEVFANFFAGKMCRERFPEINHDLNFLKTFYVPAMATDRTSGTHPIRQNLPNLNAAGLLYGNIIYDKAPVMMRMLEEQMGAEALQNGLRHYLRTFAYGNATWDDLVELLHEANPEASVRDFSDAWVKQKGLPTVSMQWQDGRLKITQTDPTGHGTVWRQRFTVGVYMPQTDSIVPVAVNMQSAQTEVPMPRKPYALIPNYDGKGYGRFVCDSLTLAILAYAWRVMPQETNRMAASMTLYENRLMNRVRPNDYLNTTNTWLMNEENELVALSLCDRLMAAYTRLDRRSKEFFEYFLLNNTTQHPMASVRIRLLRALSQCCLSPQAVEACHAIWREHRDSTLSERDYTAMAYHLAIMRPAEWQQILATQRARLHSQDELAAFDFIAKACNPEAQVQQEVFAELLKKEGRSVETWAAKSLALLNDAAREPLSNIFIHPALNALQDVQRTGSIFFPSDWLKALLARHATPMARAAVANWINTRSDYPQTLMNKVKEAAYHLGIE